MKKEKIFEDLLKAVVELDEGKAQKAANELIREKIAPVEGIEKGLSKGMRIIGEKFEKMEIYLPELLMASDIFNKAMHVLEPHISMADTDKTRKGTVIIGTVRGDIHEIGKDIVTMLLGTAGFTVHNLGKDVATSTFLEEAEKNKADIIAMSSLLTTTMMAQKELIEVLKDTGCRDKYMVMIGGAPTSKEWAEEIGADGYGRTAEDAVSVALELMNKKKYL
ncbi:MAG: hypothetical protein DRP87_18160 [Spirochaetes bacterium]|nr:MAG: hypothetical protein DRP87_18160 [Spirochaetota bacterium]